MDPRFYAIIPAAGKGTRMDTRENKQFLDLDGQPVLARTLMAFQRAPGIDGIVVSCSQGAKHRIEDLCGEHKINKLISVVPGGPTRMDSVRNALEFLGSYCSDLKEDPYVLIHDGARPLVTDLLISSSIENVMKFGACICAVPVKNTIKTVGEDGYVSSTIPRGNLCAVQTPQSFRLSGILDLYRKIPEDSPGFTDDASIAEYFGMKVKVIEGDNHNIKITTGDDLLFALAILRKI